MFRTVHKPSGPQPSAGARLAVPVCLAFVILLVALALLPRDAFKPADMIAVNGTAATEQACPCMSAHHPGTACDRASCAAQFPGLAADTGAAKPESQHGGFVGREAEARAARWLVAMQKHHAYDLSRRDFFACDKGGWPEGAWFHHLRRWEAGRAEDSGSVLFATNYAQEVLYRWQHPENCKDKKFFVHSAHEGGIGSQIHMIGAGMATAMSLGRVYLLVYAKGPTIYTEGDFCAPNSTLDTCFFERMSGCSLEDAGFTLDEWERIPEYDSQYIQDGDKALRVFANTWEEQQDFPPQFLPLMEASQIADNKRLYWYRAQAAVYMLRPRSGTLEAIRRRQAEIFGEQVIEPGTISVHVRHGDKRTETELVDDDVYWDKMAALQASQPGLQKRVLLSTYDPATVERFRVRAAAEGWVLQLVDVPRLDDDPDMTTLVYAETVGPVTEMLNSLVNLHLAVSCDAWVGTMTSNWCRLIDELRSTVGCAVERPFVDAAQTFPYDDMGSP